MSKPQQNGKKYIQLTNNILLEYIYVKDRYINGDIDDDILGYGNGQDDVIEYGTYGRASSEQLKNTNRYIIAKNGYTDELFFMNNSNMHSHTNNSMSNAILPIKKDVSQWVETKKKDGKYYSDFDTKWCENMDESGESSLQSNPINTEYIPYDILRIYFQSGYHSDYDGFIFNLYTKNFAGKYINLLCALHKNSDDVKMVVEPMWFADKLYTTYVEYRIPSTDYISTSCNKNESESKDINKWTSVGSKYDSKHPPEGTLPHYLTDSNGFYDNPAIGIDVHAITGYEYKYGYKVLKTRSIVSTLFPNKDSYDKLFANVRNSASGDFYEIYGYYEKDIESPIYDPHSLYKYLSNFNGTFTIAHIINVTENWTEDNVVKTKSYSPMTYIQTWDNLKEMYENNTSPVIRFRPVIEHAASMIGENDGALINYTLRIVSNRDNTSIIKTGSCSIIRPRRFGMNYYNATFNGLNNISVYNRIEQVPSINISQVVTPVNGPKDKNSVIQINKYVTSSFIDRRNIRVSISPIKVNTI